MAVLKNNICLLTYLRKSEILTNSLISLANDIYSEFGNQFEFVIYSEVPVEYKKLRMNVVNKVLLSTKYIRILDCLENCTYDYILSADNDISPNNKLLIDRFKLFMHSNCDICWGKIGTQNADGMISKFVSVDKLLSHNLIRPLLWKIGAGISIPGQLFFMKTDSFRDHLGAFDTYLDDLAIGLYVSINKRKRLFFKEILGMEKPNDTFVGLMRQRERWAHGYYSILKASFDRSDFKWRVVIHGVVYHFAWLINWSVIFGLLMIDWKLSILWIICISALITLYQPAMIVYGIFYQILFPIFHLRWMFALFSDFRKEKCIRK